jgi:hypothetical protein
VLATAWPRLRRLRLFLVMLSVLIGAEWFVFGVVAAAPGFRALSTDPSFASYMLAEQSLRLMVTVVVIGALLVVRGRPWRFFLALGDLRAPISPIRWLGEGGIALEPLRSDCRGRAQRWHAGVTVQSVAAVEPNQLLVRRGQRCVVVLHQA